MQVKKIAIAAMLVACAGLAGCEATLQTGSREYRADQAESSNMRLVGFSRLQRNDGDFCAQRLAERGLNRQPPQPRGMSQQRQQQARGQRQPECGDRSRHGFHPESFFWD